MSSSLLVDAPVVGAAAAGAPSGGGGWGGPPGPPSGSPVLGLVASVEAALDRLGEPALWAMNPAEQRAALLRLDRLRSRLAELDLRVLAAADTGDAAGEVGAVSTGSWLAHQTRCSRPVAQGRVRLARALAEDFPATRAALAAGRVNTEQARVIVRAVQALTREHDDLPAGTERRAEAHLLDLAEQFDPVTLAKLGKRLFEVVCPQAAEEAEGQALAREEERAARRTVLRLRDRGDGTVEGRFVLPKLSAAVLRKALEALTSPKRFGQARLDPRTGRALPSEVLYGQAFAELVEHHLDAGRLPAQGGCPFTLVVTLSHTALLSGVGAATLETGERISAGEARRLACRAGIIPMVLDGDSMPLDLGREQRLFTRYQRLALAQRHQGCAVEGCDRPPSWTEAHHLQPWSRGGRTDLDDGMSLCPPHHHMADHPDQWDMHHLPSGQVRFTRRQ